MDILDGALKSIARTVDRALLAIYAPPGLLIDDDQRVLEVRGPLSPMVQVPAGPRGWSLRNAIHGDLRAGLEDTLREARDCGAPARREGLRVRVGEHSRELTLCVVPIGRPQTRERVFAVLFEAPSPVTDEAVAPPPAGAAPSDELAQLRRLTAAQEDVRRALIEKLDRSNEELRFAHEEALAAAQELQASNEAIAMAMADLQSSNETLITLTEELRARDSAPDLPALIREAIEGGRILERLLPDGRRLRIQPCRTDGRQADGAVVTLIDRDPRAHAGGLA